MLFKPNKTLSTRYYQRILMIRPILKLTTPLLPRKLMQRKSLTQRLFYGRRLNAHMTNSWEELLLIAVTMMILELLIN